MKILYLITKSEIGGAQTHIADLCRYFKDKGHEIAVMSRGGGWLEKECNIIGVSFINNQYFSNSANPFLIYEAVKEIKKYVSNFKPEIVHCHSSMAGLLGRLTLRNSVPTVYTAHGWAFDRGTPFFRKILAVITERIAAKYCYKIICVSNFTKESALRLKIAPAEKFSVVYNGVNANDPIIRINSISDKVRILFVGRLSKQKNPALLLKSMGNLPGNLRNNIELTIVGDGPDKIKVVNIIKKTKMLPNVEIISDVKPAKVYEYLNKSDIFALITNWEGFPYTVLEAMSAGLPVIASDVGGISEAVSAETGILVKNDAVQIKEAIVKLAGDKELRNRLGKRGREIVAQKFSLEKMLNKIEEIYNK